MGRKTTKDLDVTRLDQLARAQMNENPTPAVMATVRQHLPSIARYRRWGLRWDQIAETFAQAGVLGLSPSAAQDGPTSDGELRPVKAETLRSAAHRANKEAGEVYALDRGSGRPGQHGGTSDGG